MYRFLGNIEAKVDNKGRLFVPAAYRRALESAGETSLFFRIDTVSHCAKLYPASEWEKLDNEFRSQLNLWDKNDLRLYRQFTAGVEQLDLDASGRILLQKKNLDFLAVESEALFVGVGNYFEIWNKATFENDLYDETDFSAALQEKMGNRITL